MARTGEAPLRVGVAWVFAIALALVWAPRPASAGDFGSVSGVVTAGGAPLTAAWVVLTPVTATGDWAGESLQVVTDGAGRYTFEDVGAAYVKVHVRSPLIGDFVATYWPGVYTFSQAGTIPVPAAGFVADIDLPAGRSIEGRVVAEDTGEPVEGAQLVARIAGAAWADPAGRFEPAGGPGGFRVSGLPPVPIRLHVQVPATSPFLGDGYWSDGTPAGRRVDAPGDVAGLVIRLPRGGELSGRVLDGMGRAVAGATVRIEDCLYGCPPDATSDGSGAYRIRGIAPSTRMIVHVWAPGMIDQWYDRANDWIAATPITLAAGEVHSGVDFVLTRGGLLIGQVLAGDTGRPLTGVPAYLQAVADPSRRYFAYFLHDDPDRYRIGPVPPGTYRLVLLPNSSQTTYRPARWLTTTGIASSGVIRFDPGQESEVVVTLARTQPSAPDCPGTRGWQGLFRGFLDPDPWPSPGPCPPSQGPSASTNVRSA